MEIKDLKDEELYSGKEVKDYIKESINTVLVALIASSNETVEEEKNELMKFNMGCFAYSGLSIIDPFLDKLGFLTKINFTEQIDLLKTMLESFKIRLDELEKKLKEEFEKNE